MSTVVHEFCHHLDCARLAWPESPHTRGFYHRVDQLYHAALATPEASRRPLVWSRAGGVWRIDCAAARGLRSPALCSTVRAMSTLLSRFASERIDSAVSRACSEHGLDLTHMTSVYAYLDED